VCRWLVSLIGVGAGERTLKDEENESGDEGGKEKELEEVNVRQLKRKFSFLNKYTQTLKFCCIYY